MREMKFRVWDNDMDTMLYEDNEVAISFFAGKCSVHYEREINTIRNGIEQDVPTWNECDDFELMQYAGLKDKNGKDIYEGDILELINRDGKRIIVECRFGNFERELRNFMGDINSCQITGFAFLIHSRYPTFPIVKNYLEKNDLEIMEVIGNIYEAPELLK